jgi:hypothetical protein
MNSGRLEDRTSVGSVGQLELLGKPQDSECAWIENISDHGARVISRRRWRSGDGLLITSRCPPFRSSTASVVYCQKLLDGLYAIGCESPNGGILQMLEHWTPSRVGATPTPETSAVRPAQVDPVHAKS